MKVEAEKIITRTHGVCLDIKGVMLLSIEEFEEACALGTGGEWQEMPGICWWLRSQGAGSAHAMCIDSQGRADKKGLFVGTDNISLRPALRFSGALVPGDRFSLAGHMWTVILDGTALCENRAGACPFLLDNEPLRDGESFYTDSNAYRELCRWAEEMGLTAK